MAYYIIASIVIFLLLSGAVFSYCYTYPIAKKLYKSQWTRSDENSFKRECSDASFDYHLDMFNSGMKFREKYIDKIKEVEINSLGIKLVGEYYDLGYSKAIIILPGRMETAYYGAYYLEPFFLAGYNVLCIDPRAHGLSEGKFITLGKLESIDTLNWAKYLHDELGVEKIALYGLCGGATGALLALNSQDCPAYLNTFIADGMFYSFFRLYKRHIIDEKKPVYPVIWTIMHFIKKYNGVNPYKMKPGKLIKSYKGSILILSGTKDIFALPKEAKKMFLSCPSLDKKLVYIENGRHSHLRYDNKKEYDISIIDFLKNH